MADKNLYLRSQADKTEANPEDLRLRSDADKTGGGVTVIKTTSMASKLFVNGVI
jgi:hypothetical protein